MKSFFKIFVSFTLILSLLIGCGIFSAAAVTEETVISVSSEDISYYGFTRAVQSALNTARDNAAADHPYTVVVPEGTYDLDYVLRVYSNTTLDLRGVTIIRRGAGAGNMLRVGSEDGENTGAVGYVYENVRVFGGTFDGNYGENTMIKAFHTRNFTMDDVTLLHEKEGHMTEFAGVDGLTIRGCTFQDQQLTPGNYGYEAIQIDVLHPFHITNGRCEDLPVSNVLIENCTFDDMPRAIGSHTSVHNVPHDNIVIRNNIFTNMTSIAIQGLNWTNVNISRNYIDNAPRGITVYSEPGGCTYLSSLLSQKGNTQSHVTDAYQTPAASNIEICENVLMNIGTTGDKYAWYSSQGIAVIGEKLDSKSPVDSGDESGGLPAGDYYINGASIHDNYIDIRGSGVRVEDARNVKVVDNEILCSKNSVVNDNYYGIVVRNNASASTVSYNSIKNAEMNGIYLRGTNGGKVNNVRFNRIEDTGNYGIGIYDMSIDKLEDNDILNTGNTGLFMDNSPASSIRWNRIRKCGSSGVWITYASPLSTTIESNTTSGCSGNDSFGRNTVKSHYSSGSSLTSFYIPWDTKNKVGAQMGVGAMFHIVPDVRPTNALTSFRFSSSNEAVVKVDACGMVYGVGEGTATVTVTSANGISRIYSIAVEGDGKVKHLEGVPAAPKIILGDADGSGEVDSVDPTVIMRRLVYIDTPYDDVTISRGDVDANGDLDVMDVTLIQRWLADMPTPYNIGEPC